MQVMQLAVAEQLQILELADAAPEVIRVHHHAHARMAGFPHESERVGSEPASRDVRVNMMLPRMTRLRWLLSVTIAAASIAAVAGQDPPKPERGEQIMNAACTTCHDLRPIETQALDEEGWKKSVTSMIEQGADLEADDVPVLVTYLAKQHGPLPDGPGKEILLNICTRCHDTQRIRRERLSAEGWLEILDAMLNEGAPLSERDLPVLLRYLARNFGP